MSRGYRDCMFRSEWIKDAKSKRWVASDRRDWCLKSQSESAIMSCLGPGCDWLVSRVPSSHWLSVTDTVSLTRTATETWQWLCSKDYQNCNLFCDEWKPVYPVWTMPNCQIANWLCLWVYMITGGHCCLKMWRWGTSTCDFFHGDRMELGSQCLFWNLT